MHNRKRRFTAEQRFYVKCMLGFVAVCTLFAAALIMVLDLFGTFTVYQSHGTGDVVEIRDGWGNPAPDEKWDLILAGRHEMVWVP